MTKPGRVPADRITFEALEAMTASHGYEVLAERIQATLDSDVKKLKTCAAGELETIQAHIAAYEIALGLPRQMMTEIAAKLRASDPK